MNFFSFFGESNSPFSFHEHHFFKNNLYIFFCSCDWILCYGSSEACVEEGWIQERDTWGASSVYSFFRNDRAQDPRRTVTPSDWHLLKSFITTWATSLNWPKLSLWAATHFSSWLSQCCQWQTMVKSFTKTTQAKIVHYRNNFRTCDNLIFVGGSSISASLHVTTWASELYFKGNDSIIYWG